LVVSMFSGMAGAASASAQESTVAEVEASLDAIAAHDALPLRCGTPLVLEAQRVRGLLSSKARATLDQLVVPKALDQVYLSPGGHFEIRYSIAGPDSVPVTDADASGIPDYVEWTAEAMEQSWQTEITDLGFQTIPLGPTDRYVVQLSVGGSLYGFTNFGPFPGGTFIALHHDFRAFYESHPWLIADDPDGPVRGGIRVTAAHELKHAIQYVRSLRLRL